MAESSGPPIGLLANGAAFVSPEFYNATGAGFAYANLNDQMKDASGYYNASGQWVPSGWSSGAGSFAGNNVPKYNGLPGSDPNGTFAGGFANMVPNVGGSTAGAKAYSGGFDPFAGRGNGLLGGRGPGGMPGGTPGPTTNPPAQGYTGQPTNPGAVRGTNTGNPPGPSVGGISNAMGSLSSASFSPWPANSVMRTVPGRGAAGGNPSPMGGLASLNQPAPSTGPTARAGMGAAATNAVAQGNPAGNWSNSALPPVGSPADLLARTMAASNSWNVGGTQLQGLLGSNEAMHQAGNAYNSGGSRSGGTWNTNYAAVAQNPAPYIAAGIAKANPDGTYEMLKLQDPESQQWIPIAEWQSRYGAT